MRKHPPIQRGLLRGRDTRIVTFRNEGMMQSRSRGIDHIRNACALLPRNRTQNKVLLHGNQADDFYEMDCKDSLFLWHETLMPHMCTRVKDHESEKTER